MELAQILKSAEDDSVNFIFKGDFPGFLEARYVRRAPDYFVCYLSAQSGCNKGCRFCHLTTTGQTATVDAAPFEVMAQANTVLNYYKKNIMEVAPAKAVHFSFMARGEALCSSALHRDEGVLYALTLQALANRLLPRVMISTVMPTEIADLDLKEMFPVVQPTIYYSIYSTSPEFRKKWMPKAMPADLALAKLADYQRYSGKLVKLHWAFIEGENDTTSDVLGIAEAVHNANLRVDVNIVKYNPYSPTHGKPSTKTRFLMELLKASLPESRVEEVDRVGPDVFASCGMFND